MSLRTETKPDTAFGNTLAQSPFALAGMAITIALAVIAVIAASH